MTGTSFWSGRFGLLVVGAALAAGCGGGGTSPNPPAPPPPPPPAAVASVVVTPDTTVLIPTGTRQFAATTKDAAGNTLNGRTVTWTISPNTVATVGADGLVTAVAAGTAQLTAQSEGRSGTASVTVLDGGVVGASGGLVARPDSSAVIQIPAGALTSSAAITIAPVASPPANPRLVSGTAHEFGPSGTTFSQPVTVRLKYSAAAAVGADPTLFRLHRYSGTAWQEVPGSSVDPVKREVTGQTSSFSQYAIVSLPPPVVATVTVSPDSSDLAWRGTRTLTAATLAAGGAPLSGRTVSWQSSDQSIATVSPTGLVIGVRPGTVTITATSEGVSGTARVRIVTADLSRIVDSIRQAYGLPGMGGAIVTRDGGVVALGAGGIRRVGSAAAVTVNDKWHLGSNTKALTALLATMAVEAGVISWNKTVEEAFPGSAAGMMAAHKPITLLDLVNNQSGVVNDITGLPATTDPKAGRDAWADWTVRRAGAVARGTYYYSNNGFAMAGAMVERAWNSTYEALMAGRIFQPLGVVGAGWGPTTAAGNTDQPVGHSRSGSSWLPCGGCDNRAGLSAAGTVHMPLAGWGRIIQEIMRGVDGLSPLISQAGARGLFMGGVAIGNGANYTHGWTVNQAGNAGLYASHDGSNTTNHSRVSIYVDSGLAFLMTTNAADLTANGTGLALTALQQRLQTYRQTGQ